MSLDELDEVNEKDFGKVVITENTVKAAELWAQGDRGGAARCLTRKTPDYSSNLFIRSYQKLKDYFKK